MSLESIIEHFLRSPRGRATVAPVDPASGAIVLPGIDKAGGLLLPDVADVPTGDLVVKTIGEELCVRNSDDSAYANVLGAIVRAFTRLEADSIQERTGGAGVSVLGDLLTDVIKPRTGSVITLGGTGHRVRLPTSSIAGTQEGETRLHDSRAEMRGVINGIERIIVHGTLLASYSGSDDGYRNFGGPLLSERRVALVFKPLVTEKLGSAFVRVKRTGLPPSNLRARLFSTTGTPAVPYADLGAMAVVEAQQVPTSDAILSLTFPVQVELTAGVSYAIVLDRADGWYDPAQYYSLRVDNTAPGYADGHVATYEGTWTAQTGEDGSYFEIYAALSGGAAGGGGGSASDEKVKVSLDDATADYLLNKLAAGTGITIAEVGSGGDEDVQIAADATATPTASKIPIAASAAPYLNRWIRGRAGLVVESPTAAENVTICFLERASTIKQVNAVLRGTTPSVTWNVRDSATPTKLWSTDKTTTSTGAGDEFTIFDAATIAANSWLWFVTTAKSGTVAEMAVNVEYEED